MANEGGATNTYEAQSRNMMNICTKYVFDILIISCSYGGQRRHTTDDATGMAYKLPTCELKTCAYAGKDQIQLYVINNKNVRQLMKNMYQ